METQIFYHGTPYGFDVLNKGSWLSSSINEAARHLFIKNLNLGLEDTLSGYILKIPVNLSLSQISHKVDLGVINLILEEEPRLGQFHRFLLKDIFDELDFSTQQLFSPTTSTFDLTSFL